MLQKAFIHSLILALVCLGTQNAGADCPQYDRGSGAPKASTVFYMYLPTFFLYQYASSEMAQIEAARLAWNTANDTNGSRVHFVQAYSGTPVHLFIDNSLTDKGCVGATTTLSPNPKTMVFNVLTRCWGNQLAFDPGRPGFDVIFLKIALHEFGHLMGLSDVSPSCNMSMMTPAASVMNVMFCPENDNSNDSMGLQDNDLMNSCDSNAVRNEYTVVIPPPGEGGGSCVVSPTGGQTQRCDRDDPCCPSPIIIDIDGDGFSLTSPDTGVLFDLDADGIADQASWTSLGSDDSWLVMDLNGNGRIDDGSEMFGNHTLQVTTDDPNGFLALARYDTAVEGGNGDGWIDASDEAFADLRLWHDANHNGISETDEFTTLDVAGIDSISTEYRLSQRYDEYGNLFAYRGRMRIERGATTRHVIFDVLLRILPTSAVQ